MSFAPHARKFSAVEEKKLWGLCHELPSSSWEKSLSDFASETVPKLKNKIKSLGFGGFFFGGVSMDGAR